MHPKTTSPADTQPSRSARVGKEGRCDRAEACCLLRNTQVALATLFMPKQTEGLVLRGNMSPMPPHLQPSSEPSPSLPCILLGDVVVATKLLHWLWNKKGIYQKSVCEGMIIHHHSTGCSDLPASWLGASMLLYFSGHIFSGGGHWGCSQRCS